jgi:hypothetical protein
MIACHVPEEVAPSLILRCSYQRVGMQLAYQGLNVVMGGVPHAMFLSSGGCVGSCGQVHVLAVLVTVLCGCGQIFRVC